MAIRLSASHPAVRHLAKQHRKAKKSSVEIQSELEEQFVGTLRVYGHLLPSPQREYQFHQDRRWRIDFAWPEEKLAVEIEGGIYTGGRHTSVNGFIGDMEKYNALAEAGWRILRFGKPHIEEQPFEMIEQIKRCLATP